jgi:hypothetical protein
LASAKKEETKMKKMILYQLTSVFALSISVCIIFLFKTKEVVYGTPAVVTETAIAALFIWIVCLLAMTVSEKKEFPGWQKFVPQLIFAIILFCFVKNYLGDLFFGISVSLLLLGSAGLIAGFSGEKIILPAACTAFSAFMVHLLFRLQFIPETPGDSLIIIFLLMFISGTLLAIFSHEEFKNEKDVNRIELAKSLARQYLIVFFLILDLFFAIYS